MMHRVRKGAIFTSIFVIGILSGLFLSKMLWKPVVGFQVRENSGDLPYINPILFTEIGGKNQFPDLNSFLDQSSKIVKQAQIDGSVNSVSVYFRLLNSGEWTGVNEDKLYAPASMLKVLLMIAYLKKAEQDPKILTEKYYYSGKLSNIAQNYKPTKDLVPNTSYSVLDLLQFLIVDSSNEANDLLLKHISESELAQVYVDLELQLPVGDGGDFVSPKQFSVVWRTLFSASYLSRQYSNAALDLLAHSDFTQGIVAGVPDKTVISHKFGERIKPDTPAGEKELHDCGIVYYPNNPYFLCVMTKGQSFAGLETVIKNISSASYQFVSSSSKK